MDSRLLDILCCPVSKLPVRLLKKPELEALNRSIQAGGIETAAGHAITKPLTAGLIRTDGKLIYPIEDDIPVMLADEAIGTVQLNHFPL